MAKSNAVEEALISLKALRGQSVTEQVKQQLAKGLESRANIVAARAAELVQELRIPDLEPDLRRSFERFLKGAAQDKACIAQIAITRAAVELGLRSEGIFLAGLHSAPSGPAFGESSDAVAELRGLCITGLCQMGHRDACNEAIEMLLDRKPQVRLAAARALGIGRRDEAALLLRFKLLTGDGDGDVLAECIHSLTRIWPQKSVPYLAPYLDAPDRVVRDNAAIALGGTRQREAFDLLKQKWQFGGSADAASRPALLLAIAMTRLPDAIELLLSIVSSAKPDAAGDAVEAMGMYRHDEAVRNRLDTIIKGRDTASLTTIFAQTFRPT